MPEYTESFSAFYGWLLIWLAETNELRLIGT